MEIKKTYNPLTLSHDYQTFKNEGLSPNQFLVQEKIIFTRPVILLINGIPILRKDWDLQLKQNDICHFVELPRGDVSDPLQIVAMIAVVALSIYTGGLAAAAWGSVVGTMVQGAVMIAGMALVNMFFGPSTIIIPPDVQRIDEYNIAAGRNTLQLGRPFPEHFGRFICFPSLVMGCYTEYDTNKQYFYMLGIIGVGEYDIENVYIDKTLIGDYADTSYNIIPPSGTPTLCPNLVWTSNGISGQELDTEWLTCVVTTAGIEISEIGFDIVFPSGLAKFNQEGKICARSITSATEVRTIDSNGEGISNWTVFRQDIYSEATISPLRYSWKAPVPCGVGRYEFRVKRIDAKSTSSRVLDTINIERLRGYGAAHPDYGDLTLIETKIKATDKLNGQVAQKINVVCTRKLYPVTATGFGITKAVSRSIVDACAYIVISTNGGKQSESIFDFESLYALRTILEARPNYFDYRFVARTTVMNACADIARCGRAVPYMPGGLFSLIRDKVLTTPTQVYTDDDYTKNSLELGHIIRTSNDSTCVEIEYIDPNTWQNESITYLEDGGSYENPAKLFLIGCTSRQHAWEEAGYMYKDDDVNRTAIIFTTGLKGNIPKLGDMIYVASRHVDWGQTGQLAYYDSTVATLSEPVDFGDEAEGEIIFSNKTGGIYGPKTATPLANAHKITVTLNETEIRNIHDHGEKVTKYIFGPTIEEILKVRILRILPVSNNEIRVVGSIMHNEVHDDVGDCPALGENPVNLPILDNLTLIYQGTA